LIDLSQKIILSLILRAFCIGVALGLFYEGVRIARMMLPRSRAGRFWGIVFFAFSFFTDLAFCLLFAASAILLTYNISGGVFRGCVYTFISVGLLIYRMTLGKLIERIEQFLTDVIKKSLKVIIKITLIPLRAIFSLVCRIYALTIGKIIGKIICRVKSVREKKKRARAENTAVQISPQSPKEETEEEEYNAKCARGYKKEDRISFGAYKR